MNTHDDEHSGILRVATYNIHKGVQGMGPARRLEIHNLGHAVEQQMPTSCACRKCAR